MCVLWYILIREKTSFELKKVANVKEDESEFGQRTSIRFEGHK